MSRCTLEKNEQTWGGTGYINSGGGGGGGVYAVNSDITIRESILI
jgi:hypothetical protein